MQNVKTTQLITVDAKEPETAKIADAARYLREGGLVAFPTETVYGLGANAFDPAAVGGIFTAKGRPGDNPLIVHITRPETVAELTTDVPAAAQVLMAHFWPGPLTIILPRKQKIPAIVSAGLPTVAIRMPDHPVARALIEAAGVPVAAPSANTSGRPSPTTAQHVAEDLNGKIDAILDGGPTGLGVESTVLDLTAAIPVLLRPGGVTLEELRMVLGEVQVDPALQAHLAPLKPRAPGMKYKHYAPLAPLYLVEGEGQAQLLKMAELIRQYHAVGKRVGVLATSEIMPDLAGDVRLTTGTRADLRTVAASLYAQLREFDAATVDVIIAEGLPETGWGLAVMNRLRKAAGGKIIKA